MSECISGFSILVYGVYIYLTTFLFLFAGELRAQCETFWQAYRNLRDEIGGLLLSLASPVSSLPAGFFVVTYALWKGFFWGGAGNEVWDISTYTILTLLLISSIWKLANLYIALLSVKIVNFLLNILNVFSYRIIIIISLCCCLLIYF